MEDTAIAGTQVLIRAGVYNVQLNPKHSGEENNYITYKNYGDEVVEITGESLSPAIWIDQKDYIDFSRKWVLNAEKILSEDGHFYIWLGADYKDNFLNLSMYYNLVVINYEIQKTRSFFCVYTSFRVFT